MFDNRVVTFKGSKNLNDAIKNVIILIIPFLMSRLYVALGLDSLLSTVTKK